MSLNKQLEKYKKFWQGIKMEELQEFNESKDLLADLNQVPKCVKPRMTIDARMDLSQNLVHFSIKLDTNVEQDEFEFKAHSVEDLVNLKIKDFLKFVEDLCINCHDQHFEFIKKGIEE